MEQLRIELNGGLRAQGVGGQAGKFRTRKAALLLARLALEPGAHKRDALVSWLWPDDDSVCARNRLSNALSGLRRTLGTAPGAPSPFLSSHDTIALDTERVEVDVAEWEAALRAVERESEAEPRKRQLLDALARWNGLVPDFDDAILGRHAARLNEAFFVATCRLASLDEDDERALPPLRRALALDPAREDVARALMRALWRREGPRAALRLFRELEAALRSGPKRAPSSPTRDLAREIAAQLQPQPSASTPSSLSPLEGRAARLPCPGTQFFGREDELKTVLRTLAPGSGGARLLSLWGGGGSGKTRLAIEIARRASASWNGEVAFVPLAETAQSAAIFEAIARALGLPRSSNRAARDLCIEALQRRPTLLVLDNFEHLLPDGAASVEELLESAPTLKCLVTSRRPLNARHEQRLPVAPLPVPSAQETALAALAENPSMQMWRDHARRARPDFELNAQNAIAVASLCRALEGVPLAIELAAARSLALSPAQIEEQLGARMEFLKRRVGAPDNDEPRHASVRAALDWSYELLSPDLQRALRQSAVFAGGWTLDAAQKMGLAPRGAPSSWLLEAHEELCAHCLWQAREEGDEMRFGLSETLRQYALSCWQQKESASARRALRRKHARYFLEVARGASQLWRGPGFSQWLPRLGREQGNLRAALEFLLDSNKAGALDMAAVLWSVWFSTGALEEGRRFLDLAVIGWENAPLSDAERTAGHASFAEALCGAGFLAWRQGDFARAITLCERSLRLCRASGDKRGTLYSLLPLQMTTLIQGDYPRTRALCEEALALGHATENGFGVAFSLHMSGAEREMSGDLQRALSLQEQSYELFSRLELREGQAYALLNWGSAARRNGEATRALELFDKARTLFQELSHREGEAYCLLLGSLAFLQQGDWPRAASQGRQSLGSLFELGALWGVAMALEGAAWGAMRRNVPDAARAARLWSAAQKVRANIGAPIPPVDRRAFGAFEDELKALLSPSSFDAAWKIGRTLSLDQSVREALNEEMTF